MAEVNIVIIGTMEIKILQFIKDAWKKWGARRRKQPALPALRGKPASL